MTPLEELIHARIAAEGPMPLDRYMALCLGHPEHGYYMTRQAIGSEGDFTTAPEISQMFGEVLAAWLAHGWALAGSPAPVRLVELGPGRGTLATDILKTFRLVPPLAAAVEVHLVETSPLMRAAQAERLERAGPRAFWHDSLADVPEGPMLLVANEFFDALPVRQVVKAPDGWRERCVGIGSDGRLALVDGPPDDAGDIPAALGEAEEGTVVELRPAASAIAHEIGQRLARHPGYGLIVDYGYRDPSAGDSLQALMDGEPADPLSRPGQADLTAHVDFSALAAAAEGGGAVVQGVTRQGAFLTSLGIGARAERLRAAGAPAGELTLALARLTGSRDMGTLFKVLALSSAGLPTMPPFDSEAA